MFLFISTAARYQIAISVSTITTTGAYRTTVGCQRIWAGRAAENELLVIGTLLVIGMPRTQPGAHALRNADEFRRLANFKRAVAREVATDDVDAPPRTRRQHDDLRREEHRLGN